MYEYLDKPEIEAIEKHMTDKNFSEWVSMDKYGNVHLFQLRKVGDIIRASRITEGEAPYKSTIVASIITARARRKLWEVMRAVEWCYVDTDSITVPLTELEKLFQIIEVHESKLGTWAVELCCDKDCRKFKFWNKKDYRCTNSFKLKGVPKSIMNESAYDLGEFENYERIVKPREAERRSLPPYSKVKGRKKVKR